MLNAETIAKTKRRMIRNKKFARRVEWYQLGQRRCHCCSKQLNWDSTSSHKNSATVEHMVPASKGGTYHAINILIICSACNNARGNKDWFEWIENGNFPKKEWLITKYSRAVEFYKNNYRKRIHKCIFNRVIQYKATLKLEVTIS